MPNHRRVSWKAISWPPYAKILTLTCLLGPVRLPIFEAQWSLDSRRDLRHNPVQLLYITARAELGTCASLQNAGDT
ncbi:hypothetical protein C8R44DRAFT_774123 [Mycena epipterygia]|nr:hypothetical protein C8R44DRAFT_774123 [Mycena epipterygia]